LVNSRYPRFSATPKGSRREVLHPQGHTFSRSYGVNLPSSLTRVLPSALEFSSHPPVSVSGTVSTALDLREAFPESMESWSCGPEGPPHHLSALKMRLWPEPPTSSAYRLEPLIQWAAPLSSSVPPRKSIRAGAGIFACFPSTTHFCLALGAD
jgi:hypothetical protein